MILKFMFVQMLKDSLVFMQFLNFFLKAGKFSIFFEKGTSTSFQTGRESLAQLQQ